MPFTPKTWADSPSTTTPINAAALGDLETRVTGYTDSSAAKFTQGTAAAKPAAAGNANALYFATDTGELWICNAAGSAWQSIAGSSAAVWYIGINQGSPALRFGLTGAYINLAGPGGINPESLNTGIGVSAVGKGLLVAEGANAKQGVYGPLVAGTLVVANTSVTASSRIFVCRSPGGTNPGAHWVSAVTAGTSFTVNSSSGTDTGSGVFQIFEPG